MTSFVPRGRLATRRARRARGRMNERMRGYRFRLVMIWQASECGDVGVGCAKGREDGVTDDKNTRIAIWNRAQRSIFK